MNETSATTVATEEEFDVEQYEMADTAIIRIKNLKGDDDLIFRGKAVTIEVFSPGSPQGQKALLKASRSAQMRAYRAMRGDSDPRDAEQAERDHVEKLAAFTKTINNFPIAGGAQALYANQRLMYISRQVAEGIDKLGNFSKGSSPS